MKNNNGFTLVELLSVITLLGLILLLIVPNVMNIFSGAKKNIFYDEVLNIYNNTYTTYVYRSSNGDYNKRFCVGKDSILNMLELEEKENLYYDILVNSYGEILEFKVSNEEFGINLSKNDGIKKKSIKQESISDSFEINCNLD